MDAFSLHGAQGPVAGDSKTAEMTGGLEDDKAPSPCSIRTADLDDGKLQTKERGLQGWDERSSTATISSSVSESGWSEEHLSPTPSAMRRHSMRRMRALRRMSREAHVQPYPTNGQTIPPTFCPEQKLLITVDVRVNDAASARPRDLMRNPIPEPRIHEDEFADKVDITDDCGKPTLHVTAEATERVDWEALRDSITQLSVPATPSEVEALRDTTATRSEVDTFQRTLMLRRGFGAWSRHHGMLRQESFALSCADLGKMGKAFDRWLGFMEPLEKAVLTKAMPPPPAVDTNSSLLRRKRCVTPNRIRRRQSSPGAFQQAAHTPRFQANWSPPRASPATRDPEDTFTSKTFSVSYSSAKKFEPASNSLRRTPLTTPRAGWPSTPSFHFASAPASPATRDPEDTFTSETFSVSYSSAKKFAPATPLTTPRAGEPGAVRRFTRISSDATPWRGDSMPWYNSKTASCLRKDWPERNPYPAEGAQRDVSWQEWQWALKANTEANMRARARDWANRNAWLEDRRINTPSKIVPWHVSDGGPSHRNLCEAIDKLTRRVSHLETTPYIDEQLGRDLAGQEPFFRTRSQALALYGMDLIVNEN